MASFADVVKRQRKEGSSRTGALASAVGQKTLEAIDPRKFFDQSGVLTSLFPSLKAYKARGVGDKDPSDKSLNKLATLQASGDAATRVALEEMVIKLDNNLVYSRLIAKNSTVLPQMARDANLTKQNIGRLLNLFGGTQATRASDYFKRAGEREAAVEAARAKAIQKPQQVPTQVKKEDAGMLSVLAGLFSPLTSAIGGLFTGLKTLGDDLKALLGITSSMGLLRAAIAALFSPLTLLVAPVAALAAWLINKDKKQTYTVDESGNIPGGSTPDMSSVMGQGESVSTEQMVSNIKGLPQAMKETQAEQALESGKKADPTGSYSAVERIRAERSLNPSSPTKVNATEINEDLINFIKSKEGFLPKAKWDYKQWSIGYGTKSFEGETITEAEADRRLREEVAKSQKSVIDHALKHGYNWDQKKIDALTSFAYNLGPGALNQLTAGGTRNDEEIAKKLLEYNKVNKGGQLIEERGLTQRRSQEFTMFAGTTKQAPTLSMTTPTTGPTVTAASSSVSEGRMQLATAPAAAVNYVDNSKKVQQTTPSSSTSSISAWDNMMIENLISRMA